ncbi:hypothetical protein KFE25_004879 [Diacronema lutheri]|uniref:Amine oxidase n=1 Tax=Diacronema lutheri TaxID=2081491 RepID=A0A8J5XB90_DIALT|nr:hypothetical protein KFE25_004879 [Diacronema lutheri]
MAAFSMGTLATFCALSVALLVLASQQLSACTSFARADACVQSLWTGHERRRSPAAPAAPAARAAPVARQEARARAAPAAQRAAARGPTARSVLLPPPDEPDALAVDVPDPFDPRSPPFAAAESTAAKEQALGSRGFGPRPWMWGRDNITLSVEPDTLRTFTPQQLFTPDVRTNAHLREDAAIGCLIGRADPFVLPVVPRHLRAPHRRGMEAYNPSVARVPGDGYVVSYRVDYQSGCVVQRKGMRTQFQRRRGFKHSCVVRADARLVPIGPARVLDPCGRVMTTDSTTDHEGVTQIIDVRLTRLGAPGRERVWLTYLTANTRIDGATPSCRSCCRACDWNTHVGRLYMRDGRGRPAAPAAPADADAGWAVSIRGQTPLCATPVAGRNHALFVGADGRARVQSWLYPRLVHAELPPPHAFEPQSARASGWIRATPLTDAAAWAHVRTSAAPSALRFRAARRGACAHLSVSGTSPLVPVMGAHGRRLLLGVGHLHHCPVPNRSFNPNRLTMASIRQGIAYFGSHYMHFFYALDARAPHALLAHSAEWCLPSAPGAASCEVVQFVSGLELAHGDRALILAYGANDCETRWARMPLDKALALLDWGEGAAARAPVAQASAGGQG